MYTISKLVAMVHRLIHAGMSVEKAVHLVSNSYAVSRETLMNNLGG